MDQTYNNTGKENVHNTTEGKRPAPKNIRQIGKIEDGLKIYVEDYVKTYIKQLSESEFSENPIAVLVGEYQRLEEERSVFIYGAIRIQVWEGDSIVFTEETWTQVYETIKKYFPDAEIAGWFVCGNDFRNTRAEMLKTAHLDNFAGRDKVLYLYDITEKEEQFLKYEEGELIPFSGYFIYYEKNEEMQGYMIDHKQDKREEMFVEDRVVREFRNHTPLRQDSEEQEKEKEQSSGSQTIRRTMYLAGSMLTLVVLAVGITAVKNQEKVKGLEETIHTITASLNGTSEEEKKGDNIFDSGSGGEIQGGNQTASGQDKDKLSVEASTAGITGGATDEKGKETNHSNTGETNPKSDQEEGTSSTDKNSSADPKGETSIEPNPTETLAPTLTPVITGTDTIKTGEGTEPQKPETEDHSSPDNPKTNGNDLAEKETSSEKENNENNTNSSTVDKNDDTGKNKNDQKEDSGKQDSKEKDATDTSAPPLTGDDVFIYTVKKGDTLVGICYKLYGTIAKMDFIKDMNQIINEDKIYIGQQLVVPNME